MRSKIRSVVVAALLGTVAAVSAGHATHHFESSVSIAGPAYDVTDIYIFRSKTKGHTTLIANFNPTASPSGGPPFADDGLYSFHVGFDKELSDGVTFTFRFSGTTGRMGILQGANEGVGSSGGLVGNFELEKDTEVGEGIRVWAGTIRDPFMGNCQGLANQLSATAAGEFLPSPFDNKEDYFIPRTVGSIVIDVPNELLSKENHLFVSTARHMGDEWQQVNRMGNPLLTYLFFSFDPVNLLEHVRHRPDSDMGRKNVIASHVLRWVTLVESQDGNEVGYSDAVAERLLPDLMGYKVDDSTGFSAGGTGGRSLTDDVMDSQLSLIWGKPVRDGADDNVGRYQKSFPYVVPVNQFVNRMPPGYGTKLECAIAAY